MKPITKKRLIYFILFAVLLAVEVCIALFVKDNFIRPYVGDVLVISVVYYFMRIFFPDRFPLLSLFVVFAAVAVEMLQYAGITEKIAGDSKFLQTVLGGSFSWNDIVCYAVGYGFIVLVDIMFFRAKKQ